MKFVYLGLQSLLIFSFLCHSFMLITPAIDTFGFIGCFIYILMMTISWLLYLATKEIYKFNKEEE